MNIIGIDHVTINLKNWESTRQFYQELLGFTPLPSVDMGDHLLRYFAIPGGGRLELTEYRFPTQDSGHCATDQGRARHLAFVVEGVYQLEKKLTEAGYPFHVPVSHVEQLGFSGGLTRDPNGFELEFLEYD